MAPSEHEVMEALRPVTDPELHLSIVDLGMVKDVAVRRGHVKVTVALTVGGCPLQGEITARVKQALAELRGVKDAAVELTVMSPEELEGLRRRLADRGGAGRDAPAHLQGHRPLGHEEGRPNPFAAGSRTRVVGITSGKGGVGKSSVTVNLAACLASEGHDVAVLDADVYGFSVPAMLGIKGEPLVRGQKMVPPQAHGVRCMSMGFFVEDSRPVIWRGPMLHKALEQFLVDVDWGEPELLLIDMPPGTGDVALSVAQYLPASEVYVVTTPQPAARRVAQRSAYMARKVNLPLRGVIENMSWFTGDDGRRYRIFGEGGGAQLAQELGVPLLGQVPLVPSLREAGDEGCPVVVSDPEGEAARAFRDVASAILARGPSRVYRPELTLS